MSRIGKQPIVIPDGMKINFDQKHITVTGEKGSLEFDIHPEINVLQENSSIVVSRPSDSKTHRALHGTMRAIIQNIVKGVSEGFSKELTIQGVGYRANLEDNRLKLLLGFSHDIYFEPPQGIQLSATRNKITVSGIDKQLVGQVAAKIRSFRPPEPYKGKGIRYIDEYVRIKKGKTIGGVGE